MDRIRTESEVHSASIYEDHETRTLYEMVKDWTEQPWDGVRYKRIAEGLWDSLDDLNLMDGRYGVSVTLLESVIVDTAEGMDAGLFQGDQAISNLKILLENDDFVNGARIIEVSVKTNPVCRISNADQLLNLSQSIDYRKPEWWTRSVQSYWLFMSGISIASMIIIYPLMINLGLWELNYLILSIIVGIPMYAFSYYIRTVGTKRMWRAMFIMLGAGGIGFWCILLPSALLFSPILPLIPLGLQVLLIWIPAVVGGAYIGDWLGKRRDYMPYM